MSPSTRQRIVHIAWLGGVAVALGVVFAMYVHPDFLVALVDQVWSCF